MGKLHCLIIKASKQLICKYVTTLPKNMEIKNKMPHQNGVLLWLHICYKMDPCTDECMHYIYGCDQPCLILLTSCMRVTYDNYNTLKIHETLLCCN